MKTLDACGISCPEPVLMLKQALKTETELVLLVDSKNAFDNCKDFAEKQGFVTTSEKENDIYRIKVTK